MPSEVDLRDRRSGFAWVGNREMYRLREMFDGRERKSAIAVYLTLCEAANSARDDAFEVSLGRVSTDAGVSRATLIDVCESLHGAGLIALERSAGNLNMIALLGVKLETPGQIGDPRGGQIGDPLRAQGRAVQEEQQQDTSSAGEQTAFMSDQTDSRLFATPDVGQEIHDFYRTTVPGKSGSRLTSEARKIIKVALEQRDADTLKRAIIGLASSEHHRDGGWLALKYAIGKVKQGEVVGDRIDMMAAKAPRGAKGGPVSSFDAFYAALGPASKDYCNHRVVLTTRYYAEGRKDAAGPYLADLRRSGVEPIIESDRIVGWTYTKPETA